MVKIVGIQRRQYTSKKTGKLVSGYNVFVNDDEKLNGLDGVRCYDIWLSDERFNDLGLCVGMEGYLAYNRFGGVEGFRLA